MMAGLSAEQRARNLLESYGLEGAQSMTAGELVELANLIADAAVYRRAEPIPEARCVVCDRPVVDHTWRHPVTMLDHYVTQLL